jgi:hypothetical protein
LVRDQEVGGSNPLSPTCFDFHPFGQHVEGLSPFWDKSYVDELEVQTDNRLARQLAVGKFLPDAFSLNLRNGGALEVGRLKLVGR